MQISNDPVPAVLPPTSVEGELRPPQFS